jgi:hypothetical protein
VARLAVFTRAPPLAHESSGALNTTGGFMNNRKTQAAQPSSPDMTLALTKPLMPVQVQTMLKMGDTDRAIAARAAKALKKHQSELAIAGVDGESILNAIRTSEAIIPNIAIAERQTGRLVGARLIADDKVWRAITKLHRRLQNEGEDFPKAMDDFKFLLDYFAKRSKRTESSAASHESKDASSAGPSAAKPDGTTRPNTSNGSGKDPSVDGETR